MYVRRDADVYVLEIYISQNENNKKNKRKKMEWSNGREKGEP